jgi:hypothetical protein
MAVLTILGLAERDELLKALYPTVPLAGMIISIILAMSSLAIISSFLSTTPSTAPRGRCAGQRGC